MRPMDLALSDLAALDAAADDCLDAAGEAGGFSDRDPWVGLVHVAVIGPTEIPPGAIGFGLSRQVSRTRFERKRPPLVALATIKVSICPARISCRCSSVTHILQTCLTVPT